MNSRMRCRSAASGNAAAAAAGSSGSRDSEVEIGALPISVDERLEHGALLRRTPVAGVDRAEKRARRRLDLSVVDDACHEVGIMAYSSDWL